MFGDNEKTQYSASEFPANCSRSGKQLMGKLNDRSCPIVRLHVPYAIPRHVSTKCGVNVTKASYRAKLILVCT
jgi:hypothetical protein